MLYKSVKKGRDPVERRMGKIIVLALCNAKSPPPDTQWSDMSADEYCQNTSADPSFVHMFRDVFGSSSRIGFWQQNASRKSAHGQNAAADTGTRKFPVSFRFRTRPKTVGLHIPTLPRKKV